MPFSLSGMRCIYVANPRSPAQAGSLAPANRLTGLVQPIRAVAFSPGGKFLAAAGDSKVIVLYETSSGEQVASLTGHAAWILSLSWSSTGEYLLSG